MVICLFMKLTGRAGWVDYKGQTCSFMLGQWQQKLDGRVPPFPLQTVVITIPNENRNWKEAEPVEEEAVTSRDHSQGDKDF